MTERASDHVPLPHADQVVDDEAVLDVSDQSPA